MHQLTRRPLRLAAAVAILTLALVAALIALPRDQATATPPSGIAAELLARGTVAQASHVRVAGIKLATRGPVDVATVQVTFQPGGSTGWHVHPGPAPTRGTCRSVRGDVLVEAEQVVGVPCALQRGEPAVLGLAVGSGPGRCPPGRGS